MERTCHSAITVEKWEGGPEELKILKKISIGLYVKNKKKLKGWVFCSPLHIAQ